VITIYHLETSRSERIVWLMEELGLPYRLEVFPRNPNGAAPDALKAMSSDRPCADHSRRRHAARRIGRPIVDYIVHSPWATAASPFGPTRPNTRAILLVPFRRGKPDGADGDALVLSRLPRRARTINARVSDRVKQLLTFVDRRSRISPTSPATRSRQPTS